MALQHLQLRGPQGLQGAAKEWRNFLENTLKKIPAFIRVLRYREGPQKNSYRGMQNH